MDWENTGEVEKGHTTHRPWQDQHDYEEDDIIRPANNNPGNFLFRAMDNGTSGDEEPEWDQEPGAEVHDGDA